MSCFQKILTSRWLSTIKLSTYLFLMMAYSAFCLAFSILAYTETLKFSLDFAGIQNNWASDVINAVSIETSPSNCSNGTEPLFVWTWPGTEIGCNCNGSSDAEQMIFEGECSTKQNSSQCEQIPGVDPMVFSYWKDSYIVCVSRIEDYNFAAHHLMNSPTCPSGHTPCGKSLDYIFCVLNNTDCPITSMVVSDENPDPFVYFESAEFFGRYRLWYSRLLDRTPLVQGKISQNNPCFDYSLTNTDEGEEDYLLLRKKRIYCEEDPRWESISTITEKDFYGANVQIENLTNQLPNYTISDFVNERLWSLYIRNVIPMRYEFICRSAIDKLVSSDEIYSTEIDTQLTTLVVSCITFVFYVFLSPYMQITLFFKKNLFLQKIEDDIQVQMRTEQQITAARTIKLIHFPFILVAMVISFSDMKIFEELYDNQCSDSTTNQQFKESAENIRTKTYYYNFSMLIFLASLIVLDIIIMIVGAIVERNNKKKEDQEIGNEEYVEVKMQGEEKVGENEDQNNEEKKVEDQEKEGNQTTKKESMEIELQLEKEKKEPTRILSDFPDEEIDFPDEEIDENPNRNNPVSSKSNFSLH